MKAVARAIWKGTLRFGKVQLPVKLYSAVADRKIHFRLLHEKDLVPVHQHMVEPESGRIVSREEMRKGYEADSGAVVVLEDDELAALEPEASRDIEITRFVPASQIDHQWYERPYYLGPDEDTGSYFALARALAEGGREGVARWVMRTKEYAGSLRERDGRLVLITLRHAGEVIPASALPAPGGRKLDTKELAMARQLLDSLAGTFDPEDYADHYRERVLELVEAKSAGRVLEFPKRRRRAASGSLTDLLAASLKRARAGGAGA